MNAIHHKSVAVNVFSALSTKTVVYLIILCTCKQLVNLIINIHIINITIINN